MCNKSGEKTSIFIMSKGQGFNSLKMFHYGRLFAGKEFPGK